VQLSFVAIGFGIACCAGVLVSHNVAMMGVVIVLFVGQATASGRFVWMAALFAEFSLHFGKVFHGFGELVCELLVAVGDGGKGSAIGVCGRG
jgi:hypothetical protein